MHFLLKFLIPSLFITITKELQTVKIGALFFKDEFSLMEAFDSAVTDINALDTELRFKVVKHFLAEDDSVILQNLACDLLEQGVLAIFGPSSKSSSDIVAVLCNQTGIPHLQFDWSSKAKEGDMRYYQFTINVAPSESTLSQALWEILRSREYDWKSFTIVYEVESNLSRYQHLLSWKPFHRTGLKMVKFRRGDDYRILWKILSNMKEKFILLDCPPDILKEVVNISIYYNMTGGFNNLFLANLDTHASGLASLYSKKFTAKVTAIRLRRYIPPGQQGEYDIFQQEPEESIVLTKSQSLYDAVILYYEGLRMVIKSGSFRLPAKTKCGLQSWSVGEEIVKHIKQFKTRAGNISTFKTQKMFLSSTGLRDDFNLEIYNPLVERIVYIWNKGHGLVDYEKLQDSSIQEEKRQKLSPGKEDFSLKRVRYTIATRMGEPYFMWRPEPEGVHYEGNERFEGYVVDLIYKLAEECKFDFIFEPVADNNYGSYDSLTDEWNGIIRQLIDNNAQLGICDLTITQARRSVVDFTVPFMQLGVSILHHKPKPAEKRLFAFLKPFSLDVWLCLLVALLLMALLLTLMVRLNPSEWQEQQIDDCLVIIENKWFLRNSLWLYIGSILGVSYDLLPKASSLRLCTAFWWLFALLMSRTYTAKLASFITASKLEGSIKNLHDLVEQNKVQFGMVKGGSTSLFFSESNESDYRVAWNKMLAMKPEAFTANNREGVDRVRRSKGRYAFLMETPNIQYYAQRNCELMQIGPTFSEKHYGIAVPLNAPFRSNLSVGILKLSEKGILYNLKNKWFNNNETKCIPTDLINFEQSTQFNINSVGGLFIVLLAGLLVAIVLGIVEFLWNTQKIAIKEKKSPGWALREEFQFFICFWRKSKPFRNLKEINEISDCHKMTTKLEVPSNSHKVKAQRKKTNNLDIADDIPL